MRPTPRTRALKVLRLIRLGQHVNVRQLQTHHCLQCEQRARDKLCGVAAVVRVNKVQRHQAEVQRAREAAQHHGKTVVRRVQLRLAGRVKNEVRARGEVRRERPLQPVKVRLQKLHAVQQRAVWAQPVRLHRVTHGDQRLNVHARRVRRALVGGVEVNHNRRAADRVQEVQQRAAVRGLARPWRPYHQLAKPHHGVLSC